MAERDEDIHASFAEGAKRKAPERVLLSQEVDEGLRARLEGRRFFIRTFGCQANIRDEEVMAGLLSRIGMRQADSPGDADLAVINTCAVRENAVDKVYGEIGEFKAVWQRKRDFILILSGCAMEEEGLAEKLMGTYPWVRLAIGTHEVPFLLDHLRDALSLGRQLVRVRSSSGDVVEDLPSLRRNEYSAFVNISYGCDKFCTYCIVPYTRGRERSRRKGDILAECRRLVEDGFQEIVLLGQNVNSYGLDLGEEDAFPELLSAVADLGIPRLRFITSYPSQFTDRMIEAMASHPNILPWLHFPVQSGSERVLRKMGRRYGRDEYLALVRRLYEKIPGLAITTDIIVGFPGETEEDFQETLSLCREARFSSAFTFIYSPRPGTPAAKMGQVPDEVSHDRFNRLKSLIDELTAAHSEGMVGKTFPILVDGPSKKREDILSGYAPNGKLVNFPGPSYLKGTIVQVKILESHAYSLLGELAEDPVLALAKELARLLRLDPALGEYRLLLDAIRNDGRLQEAMSSLPRLKKDLALSMGEEARHAEALKRYREASDIVEGSLLLKNADALSDRVETELALIANVLGGEG